MSFPEIQKDLKLRRKALWNRVDEIDARCGNSSTIRSDLPEPVKEIGRQAREALERDPSSALALYEEAASLGDPHAMVAAGWMYEYAIGTERNSDKAYDYYHQAMGLGSWQAVIYYARQMDRLGHRDICISMLEDAVEVDHLGAYFWLAWFRYKYDPTRRTAASLRPLLDHAIGEGHPGAKWLLARLLVRGKYGFTRIGEGIRLIWDLNLDLRNEVDLKSQLEPGSGGPASGS